MKDFSIRLLSFRFLPFLIRPARSIQRGARHSDDIYTHIFKREKLMVTSDTPKIISVLLLPLLLRLIHYLRSVQRATYGWQWQFTLTFLSLCSFVLLLAQTHIHNIFFSPSARASDLTAISYFLLHYVYGVALNFHPPPPEGNERSQKFIYFSFRILTDSLYLRLLLFFFEPFNFKNLATRNEKCACNCASVC
jgi:hypothetical protein